VSVGTILFGVRQPVPFGKYLLLDRISVGGMAEVFKAKSYGVEGFEKIIAIKRILPTMGEDRDFIKMFIDEAKIAGQLAHANICQIFELGRIDGSHFIAMEYIWGKDCLQIQNRLRKTKQSMPVPMACFVIAKVLEGLDYAHRKRDPLGRPLEIVHRDCSPQNVLVSYEGEVKLIDFGIAKATSRNSRTMAGVLKGKFGYMSPEQVRGLPLDRRSDIFAIGTMLYECLTGERLFQGETDFSTLEKVRNVDIQPPRALNPDIPESVEKVILKALAKDVEDRYQWCSEMLADLQAYLMGQDVVFTAKSLSSWLKEVFAQEIERERQLLEQYKRVGRDGLIAGVPSAEAKLDVNEHLGAAGAPEGDATTLGGPSFDDVEKDTGATPDPYSGANAAGEPRHAVQRTASPPAPGSPGREGHPLAADSPPFQEDEEGEADFHDEAPTEIYGEIEGQQQQPAAAANSGSRGHPSTKPPRPPPQPSGQMPMPMVAGPRSPTANMELHGMPHELPTVPASLGTPPGPQPTHAYAHLPNLGRDSAPSGELQRTVLGVQAPQVNAYRPSGQMQMPPPSGYYPQQPSYPGYPPGYGQAPYGAYPHSGPMGMVAMQPVDAVPGEGKRSTLVRDIAIGVGIAALVLVGFLVVKMFVLDKDKAAGNGSAASNAFATIKFAMPKGMSAEMYVNDARVATVTTDSSVPVSAGIKHIRLVSNGLSCDEPQVTLEAGKTLTLECNFGLGSDGAVAAPPAPPQGSATQVAQGSGSAGSATEEPKTVKESKKEKTEAKTEKPKTEKPKTEKTEKPKTEGKGSAEAAKTESAVDPTKGYLQLTSKPPAKVLIDGSDTGKMTPVSGLAVAPGKHKITFIINDDKFTYPVNVTAGQTVVLSKDLQ